jgi:hypothetical protein
MASLAEIRPLGHQELVMGSAMRCVTGRAILRGRWVLPEKGSPFFGVAFITFLIQGIGREEFLRDRSVGIVATGTGHFPLSDGVMGRFLNLRLYIFMTLAAYFCLVRSRQVFRFSAVNAVAIRT